VLRNAVVMAQSLEERGLRVVSGGTESHMFLLDLRAMGVTGKEAEALLGRAHITVNKNAIPNDPQKPMVTSGIRIGSAAMTTRGFAEEQAQQVAAWIAAALEARDDERRLANISVRVKALCEEFPVYFKSTAA
jgi:glycine hydroxymethyltransferase